MNSNSFKEPFKWFLVGAIFFVLAWAIGFYIPGKPSKWLTLLLIILGIFALWQCYRIARVYRASHYLVVAGISIILAAPVFAQYISALVVLVANTGANYLELKLPFDTNTAISLIRPPLSWTDGFHAMVGFGLIAWGWMHRGETTTVVITNSEEEITKRIEKL